MERRVFLMTGAAAMTLASCGAEPPGAGVVTINATGNAGMNPGLDGSDRPVTLAILQLSSLDAFNTADALSLQDPATALGTTLIAADQLVVTAGATVSKVVTAQSGVAFVAVVAGFRSPAGKAIKGSTPVAAGDVLTATVNVTSSGITFDVA